MLKAFGAVALAVTSLAGTATALQGHDPELLQQRTRGKASAPITIYEVADFQCPACRSFWANTEPTLIKDYIATGKARLIFVNFPITELHHNSAAAHEFAMCAARQDRFWPVHDLLYRHQDSWAELKDPAAYFHELADSARLQRDSLDACLSSGAMQGIIASEAQAAFRAGIRSTPSFVVNRALLTGAAPITAWRPILDSIYAATQNDSTKPRTGGIR
jgi:protein-disulfide isomerase